ncbi:MAG: hypothetical protein JNM25_01135 [Planctomycetes bacterium]|nr:hypothetical protein [Planctomycetota bacterium]
MKLLLRLVLPLAVAALVALPGIGSDGGDNAGGTGVWILPRPTFLASGALESMAPAVHGVLNIASCGSGVALAAGAEMGDFVATLIDPISGMPIALPTNGRQILLSASLLADLKLAAVEARIVVSDSQHLGYVLGLALDSTTGACTVRIF